MDSFDPFAMPYLQSPLSINNMHPSDYLNAMPPLDMPDQQAAYDNDTFVR